MGRAKVMQGKERAVESKAPRAVIAYLRPLDNG